MFPVGIPQEVLSSLPDGEYFDVKFNDGVVVLKPIRANEMDPERVRAKILKLGLSQGCVKETVCRALAVVGFGGLNRYG